LVTDCLIDSGATFKADYSGTAKDFYEFVERKLFEQLYIKKHK